MSEKRLRAAQELQEGERDHIRERVMVKIAQNLVSIDSAPVRTWNVNPVVCAAPQLLTADLLGRVIHHR